MSTINKIFRIGLALTIIGIILKQFFDTREIIIQETNSKIIPLDINNPIIKTNVKNNITPVDAQELQSQIAPVSIKTNMPILREADDMKDFGNGRKMWLFSSPNPWNKIVYDPSNEYPWAFYLKTKIPSLNSYDAWKNIIPNIDLVKNSSIIIPSKDEASALAIANLMVINFSGDMSLDDILKKNLIQISISKAKSHLVVQNKLREQLNSSKKTIKPVENMCNTNKTHNRAPTQNFTTDKPKSNIDFTASGFSDTFEHFNDEKITMDGIQAFENNDLVKF
jgi:hypothetical protein